jgi:hypothetical protein
MEENQKSPPKADQPLAENLKSKNVYPLINA